MGKLELESLRDRRHGYIKDAVLATLAISGLIAVSLIAPNTLQLLGKFGIVGKRLGDQSKTALTRLKKAGLIEFVEREGKSFARITSKGEKALEKYRARSAIAERARKRWDKRYRVVIFDIPSRRKGLRDSLRWHMKEIGFIQLQQSVWVYPHDCEDFIALLKTELHIGKQVTYMIVDRIENDAHIRRHFNLPPAK